MNIQDLKNITLSSVANTGISWRDFEEYMVPLLKRISPKLNKLECFIDSDPGQVYLSFKHRSTKFKFYYAKDNICQKRSIKAEILGNDFFIAVSAKSPKELFNKLKKMCKYVMEVYHVNCKFSKDNTRT